MNPRILLPVAAGLSALSLCAAIDYHPVKIGGGGYVAGVFASSPYAAGPPQVFFRTDVGAIYRGNFGTSANGSVNTTDVTWVPLNNRFTIQEQNWYGGDSIALSKLNTSHIFQSCGAYFESDEAPAGIFASVDAGDSWRMVSPPQWGVYAGSNNSSQRGMGERLAVHPHNESILLYGSYLDGIWRTGNADADAPQWTQTPCSLVPCSLPQAPYGVLSVLFDAASDGGNTAFASVPGVGIFISTDAGLSWALMAGSPATIDRLSIATYPGTQLPLPQGQTAVLWAAGTDGLWRTDGSSARKWQYVPTPLGRGVEFSGIDVNPWDPLDVIALTHVGGNDPHGLVRTLDGGASFVVTTYFQQIYQLPWWFPSFYNNGTTMSSSWGMATSYVFSPFSPSQAFVGDSWNVWQAINFDVTKQETNASSSEILQYLQQPYGHEEVFVLSMIAPPAGPTLVAGTADLSGFVFQSPSLADYPEFCWFGGASQAWGAEGVGADFTELIVQSVPARMVVVQQRGYPDNRPLVYTSDDGGAHWLITQYNASADRLQMWPLGVSISAYDPDNFIVLVQNGVPQVTMDGGSSWRSSAGLPPFSYEPFSGNRYNMSRPLASDRPSIAPGPGVNGTFFYADCRSGMFYSSADRGASFAATSAQPLLPPSPRCDVTAHPLVSGTGGLVWVALDLQGLYFTSDGGRRFTRVPDVLVAHTVSVGAPIPGAGAGAGVGAGEPVVYIFGLVAGHAPGDNAWQLYASAHRGAAGSWVDLGSTNGFGLGNWPATLAASRQYPGLAVVGSFGTGAAYTNSTQVQQAMIAAE